MESADDPGAGVALPHEPEPGSASGPSVRALRVEVGEETSRQANRRDWDRYADE